MKLSSFRPTGAGTTLTHRDGSTLFVEMGYDTFKYRISDYEYDGVSPQKCFGPLADQIVEFIGPPTDFAALVAGRESA